jgi:hypothetical protein
VGHCFELIKCKEAGGTFNGVDRSKNAGQGIAIRRVLFEHNQILIQAIKVFVTFD